MEEMKWSHDIFKGIGGQGRGNHFFEPTKNISQGGIMMYWFVFKNELFWGKFLSWIEILINNVKTSLKQTSLLSGVCI